MTPAGSSNNNQQHPIIFGKSKDSILVPEFLQDHQLEDHLENCFADAEHNTTTAATATGGHHQTTTASQQTTTHVLTDEKGHSIKIRIASPPPQRQSQLAKLHKKQQQQAVARHFEHRDSLMSLSSESPLMSPLGVRAPFDFAGQQATTTGDESVRSPELGRRARRPVAASGNDAWVEFDEPEAGGKLGTSTEQQQEGAADLADADGSSTSDDQRQGPGGAQSLDYLNRRQAGGKKLSASKRRRHSHALLIAGGFRPAAAETQVYVSLE